MLESANRDLIARTIKEHNPSTIAQLAALIKADGAIDEETFVETVKDMVRNGSLKLEGPKYLFQSFLDYLFTLDVSLWFWLTIAIITFASALAMMPSGYFPLDVLRWCFGSVFVVFLPGYSCLRLLFPRPEEMRKFQRYIFSVPVSLAIVIIMGLLLNYSNIGINLFSLLGSVGALILIFAVAAAIRLYSLNKT